jgi:competence protein ComEC
MKLRWGYIAMGIATGVFLLLTFIWSQPDGRLHIVFCSVGQGDAAYLRLPDGRDMLIDGGPANGRVLTCLGRHMPFWDRHINIVVMTHPEADHMGGLAEVFNRYSVDYFVRSDVGNLTASYKDLSDVITRLHVPVKYVLQGDHIDIGPTSLSVLWPSRQQVAKAAGNHVSEVLAKLESPDVLGTSTIKLNDYSVVLAIRYGTFDAVFPGDADSRVEAGYDQLQVFTDPVELLKVPHHGSKTGMTAAFIDWLKPKLAVISVGKNTYGHPSNEAVRMLQNAGSEVLRTDQKGDIEVVSDGRAWIVKK